MTIWLSFDVETTGPVPGVHAMLSFGIEAILQEEREFRPIGCIERNMSMVQGQEWDPSTYEWWHSEEQADALEFLKDRRYHPGTAMRDLLRFLENLPAGHAHVWAAYPATFDMPFIRYYAHRFMPRGSWQDLYMGDDIMQGIACFDMGSFAAPLLECDYHDVSKSRMPVHWTDHVNPHPHVAIHDARYQAKMLIAMLKDADVPRYGSIS